jgi:RNA polymerase sigma-70 factor (ECF subfamily)
MSTDLRPQFEQLIEAHGKIIFHVARIYARDREDRNDIAQEIRTQLWRAFPEYSSGRRFSTWMYRIALNVAISHLRRESRRREHFEPIDGMLELEIESVAAGHDEETDERLLVLRQLIAELDPLNRGLVLLYLEEHSYSEIAEILGITETNVATKINRIKQRLRQQMLGNITAAEGA